jgi:lipopolysaccharide/colanic/teichoic acid biosynthesis glycosyltransferase
MSAGPLTNTERSKFTARPASGRGNREPLSEKEFLSVISWERRRSERSGNSFLLALVHLKGLNSNERDYRLKTGVTLSLPSVIRETDTAGWYKEDECLGIIFTDLKGASANDARANVDAKLKKALCDGLPATLAKDILITYHSFPEDDAGSGPDDPFAHREGSPASRAARILKRYLDVAGSLLALLILSPLLLLIAIAVKVTSEGPVLCRQARIGAAGRTFTFLKFRSMLHNNDPSLHRDYVTRMIAGQSVARADSSQYGIYKIVNDPRVTPLGRFLRRSSLDELPQFFNVLKGDMSLVGPRPPLPYEFERYFTWHRRRVLEIKPGITGLWQICGRSKTSFDEMVRLDLRYAREWSLWLDLKILLETPIAVIFRAGAY